MAGTALFLRPLIHSPIQNHPTRPATRTHSNPTRIRTRNPRRPPSSTSSSSSSSQQNPNSPKGSKPEPESPLSGLLNRVGVDGISLEILYIALPAVLALAADPIASLVDTAFVGHLGSAELAAIGVSVSLINLVSKLFNVPLLNVTTSFVAEQQALDSGTTGTKNFGLLLESQEPMGGKKYLPAVSTSLALAACIGIVEAITLSLGSGPLLNFMGIPVDSPMHIPAEQFLILRSFGAPPVVIALAAQGTFRGFMDTKTPLYAVGGLLIGRTVAVLLTMTLATSMAAREGPVPMAGHQICLQVWLAVSLLNDALALAGQALLASEFTKGNYKQARLIVHRVLQVLVGLASSVFLLIASPVYGLAGVWTGLFLFMTLRAAAGFWRLGTRGGPWEKVLSESELGMTEE